MTRRYKMYREEKNGQLTPYKAGRGMGNLPYEESVWAVVDMEAKPGSGFDARLKVVARFDGGTAFPFNPMTQAWNEMQKLESAAR